VIHFQAFEIRHLRPYFSSSRTISIIWTKTCGWPPGLLLIGRTIKGYVFVNLAKFSGNPNVMNRVFDNNC
jgi:hypothetical protein